MEEKQLKKFLAGLCITGLLSGAGLTVGSAAEEGKSGWGASKPGAVSTPSGWSGTKPGAVGTPKGEQKPDQPKPAEQTSGEQKPEQKPGQSGWSGTKK